MPSVTVVKGNTKVLKILCKDENGDIITTLASAEEVKFHVKEKKTDVTAKIAKSLTGGGIEVDTPSTGYVQVTLLPADTALIPKSYPIGLEIKWDNDNIYEADEITIDDVVVTTMKIVQDVVNT